MAPEEKQPFIVLAIPVVELVYCAIVIGSMLAFPTLRNHAPWVGGIAVVLPLIVGVSLWICPKE
ncbi:MAG: hypothetical protein F6K35_27640 [Okeania sp. SIO2H7]|nr:hypothetical protein [Okeania sp. SIO2H7]